MEKAKDEEKNLQEGHRARIIESYSKIDIEDLSPHQVLEYILFYVFPRGDVSALAHRLLERFGSVAGVLEANEHSLMQVYGINERSAKMIVGFARIFDYYTSSKMKKRAKISHWSEIYDACESLVRFQNKEVLYIIGLDASFRIITQRKLGTGSAFTVASSSNTILDFINETKSAFIIFTHNHPGGSCKPSMEDKRATDKLKEMLLVMHANFIDHVIVGSDGIFSFQFDKQVRSFIDSEAVKKLARLYSGE